MAIIEESRLDLSHLVNRPFCPSQFLKMATQSRPPSLQILTILLTLLSVSQISTSLRTETEALLDFKKHIIDPLNILQSWENSDNSPCKFYGVLCDQESGLVTEISLDNKSLSGVISPSLSPLQNLTSLVLTSNTISGPLPYDLTNCLNLKVLNVSDNYMNGSVPDLSSLTKLEALDLSDNSFSGAFPSWVGNLTGLTSLGLGDNDYDEGGIPQSIGNLKKLNWLYLANSNLSGVIPESIFDLERLGTLDLCNNKIVGKFPPLISKLKNLFKIEMYNNNLTGEIPVGLSNLTLLEEFDVSNNQMYGEIPSELGNLKKLTVFHLFKNNFSGQIPPAFGDMKYLSAFSVYRNGFTGEFPPNMGRFSPLNSVDISENKFTGPFPKYLCKNGNLQMLLALDNGFTGVFPDSYGECKSLLRLRVNKNKLVGAIPAGAWALPNVGVIDFSENGFTGGVSPEIEGSFQLNELILSNNRFSGEVPKELGKLTKLERIYLNNNEFYGGVPSELGGLEQITSLHLEVNAFMGSIPSDLVNCPRLVDLNLASNKLSGGIPVSFSKMTSLNSLNLSRNWLTGPIPRGFDKLKLSSVDLSDNRLTGGVPPYFLTIAGGKALSGNKGLCVVDDNGNNRNSGLSPCDGQNGHKSFIKNRLVMVFIILVALVFLLCGLLLVSYRNFKRSEDEKQFTDEKAERSSWKIESFQHLDIDVDEICDVGEDNLVGSGSTGNVYRLDLKKGCESVAVKQLWRGNRVAAEMDILGKIRHRNIVKLYACLMREGSNYLVFEYMSNGNLSQALDREIKGGKAELDWYQRYRIALGAAKGLAYLHHDCNPPIVHRDIKSTNILLDDDYEAKIADFGIAKVADQASPMGSEMSCFAGTHGYIAPEMAYSLKITEKSDVYSFGVVLLELVTGKRPIDEAYGEGKDLVYWVSTHLDNRENVLKVVDHKIVSELVQDDVIKVLKIATLCTAKLPNLRPSMKEVIKMLIDAEPCILKSPDSFEKNGKAYF